MTEPTLTKALLTPRSGPHEGQSLTVHFNPVSLDFTVTNTLQAQNRQQPANQFVSKSSAKLTMELIFDTTDTGQDVRGATNQIVLMMEPSAASGQQRQNQNRTPAIVEFEWGTYSFQGIIESLKETLDFFSPDGVPLRSKVGLTLTSQENVFQSHENGPEHDVNGTFPLDEIEVPMPQNGAAQAAANAGAPSAGADIAAQNGLENLRFADSASLNIDASVVLGAPVAFSAGISAGVGAGAGYAAELGMSVGAGVSLEAGISGGIGVSAGAGISGGVNVSAGAGISGGVNVSAGAGISGGVNVSAGARISGGVNVSAGAAIGLTGGAASAGVCACQGAFAGLRKVTASSKRNRRLDIDKLRPPVADRVLSTDARAGFELGGQALSHGSASLSTDVGLNASLRFDEEK